LRPSSESFDSGAPDHRPWCPRFENREAWGSLFCLGADKIEGRPACPSTVPDGTWFPFLPRLPTACAVGCTLTALCGWGGVVRFARFAHRFARSVPSGLKPASIFVLYAALKRRSSTVVDAFPTLTHSFANQRQGQPTGVSVPHVQGQREHQLQRHAPQASVVPTFRKRRERWAPAACNRG